MECIIEKATEADLDQVEQLYDELVDYLLATVNYPKWIKGVYPTRKQAQDGLDDQSLYTAKIGGELVGAAILTHKLDKAYVGPWKVEAQPAEMLVFCTLVVHPKHLNQGLGKMWVEYVCTQARAWGLKTIRLCVYEHNTPAKRLYERYGFEWVGDVDLGFKDDGLAWFHLYEKVLEY